jgi:hypothetical protein
MYNSKSEDLFGLSQYHQGYVNITGIDKSPVAIKLATEISHQECVKVNLQVRNS